MRRSAVVLFLVALSIAWGLTGCGPAPTSPSAQAPTVAAESATPFASPRPSATHTLPPSPSPTPSQEPTSTPAPSARPTRTAAPQQYIQEFGNLAKTGNTYVVPANLGDLTSMMALATDIAKGKGKKGAEPSPMA